MVTVQRNFMVAMYVIFLGMIPSIVIALLIIYYSKHNVLLWWKKPRKSYVPKIYCARNARRPSTRVDINHFFNNTRSSIRSLLKRGDGNLSTNPVDNKVDNAASHFIDDKTIYANVSVVVKTPNAIKPSPKNESNFEILKMSQKHDRAKLEIIKTGLSSTTNESVSKPRRSKLYSIRNSGLYMSGENVKVHGFDK